MQQHLIYVQTTTKRLMVVFGMLERVLGGLDGGLAQMVSNLLTRLWSTNPQPRESAEVASELEVSYFPNGPARHQVDAK